MRQIQSETITGTPRAMTRNALDRRKQNVGRRSRVRKEMVVDQAKDRGREASVLTLEASIHSGMYGIGEVP